MLKSYHSKTSLLRYQDWLRLPAPRRKLEIPHCDQSIPDLEITQPSGGLVEDPILESGRHLEVGQARL